MGKIFKRTLATIMVVLMVITSAPLSGDVGTRVRAIEDSVTGFYKDSIVELGSYPQKSVDDKSIISELDTLSVDDNGDVSYESKSYRKLNSVWYEYEPIKWRVVKNDEEDIVLFAENIIDSKPFHTDSRGAQWLNSYLLNWLNSTFKEQAFAGLSNLETRYDVYVSVPSKEFLSSTDNGFNSNNDRKTSASDYATSDYAYYYWTCDPWWAYFGYAHVVGTDSGAFTSTFFQDYANGVRPIVTLKRKTINNSDTTGYKLRLRSDGAYGDSIAIGEKITLWAFLYNNGERENCDRAYAISFDKPGVFEVTGTKKNESSFDITLKAKKAGTVNMTVSDSKTGAYVTMKLKANNPVDVLTFDEVKALAKQYEGILTNFYDYNGLYVNNFLYSEKNSDFYSVQMNVYNEKAHYGAVVSYYENGTVYDYQMIDPMDKLPTNLWDGLFDMFDRINYEFEVLRDKSYTDDIRTKWTPVKIDVPKGGYIEITNDLNYNEYVIFVNAVDVAIDAYSAISGLDDLLNQEAKKKAIEMTITEIIKKVGFDGFKSICKKLSEDLVKFSVSNIDDFFAKIIKVLKGYGVDFEKIIKESLDMEFNLNLAEDAALTLLGGEPIKKILEGVGYINTCIKIYDMLGSILSSEITIYAPQKASKTRQSNGVTVTSETELASDCVLHTYVVHENSGIMNDAVTTIDKLNSNYEMHDITLYKSSQAVQPDAKITVMIPIPAGYNKDNIQVFWYKDDGTMQTMNAVVKGDYAVFETDHLSYYLLVEDHKCTYEESIIDATCIEDGAKTYACVCGEVESTETIPAINHVNKTSMPYQDATCSEAGHTEGVYCPDCETWLEGHEVINATGHSDEDKDNLCDACGELMCDILVGETKTIEIKSNEITYLKFIPFETAEYSFESISDEDTYGYLFDADKNQLYSNDDGENDYNFAITYKLTAGETYYWGASFCDEDESGSFDVTLTMKESCKHEDVETDDGTAATCTSSGYTAGTYCSDCKQWIVGHEYIDELGHSYSSSYTIDTEATCITEGSKSKHCTRSNCNGKTSATVIAATGHSYGPYKTTKSETCTSAGSKQRICSVCNDVDTASIAKLGHKYSSSYTTDTVATCTAEGSKSKHCTRSGCSAKTSVTVIPKAAHTEIVVVGKSATYTNTGLTDGKKCSVCGTVTLEQQVIAKKTLGTTSKITTTQTTSSVTLKWNKVTGASGYRIFQKVDGKWKTLTDTTNLTYTVKSLKANTKYEFAVRAYVLDGSTKVLAPKYKSVSATTSKAGLGTTSSITATKTSSSVKLTWNKVSGATGYRVYQKVSSGWKTLANTTNLTYTIKSLKANTSYTFAVRAYVTKSGKTTFAPKYKSIAVTTEKASSKPGQVKNVKATPTATTVKLTWSKVSGVKGYYVFSYNSKTKKYTSLGKTTGTSYTVKNRKANTAYQYAVQAYKVSGGKNVYGKVSSVVKVTTLLAAPTVKITSTKGKANLTWTNISGEGGYAIYMATSKNGKYTHLANYKANSTKATKSKLTSGKTYYFKVRAYKKVSGKTVYGAYSAVKSVKIK